MVRQRKTMTTMKKWDKKTTILRKIRKKVILNRKRTEDR